MKRVLQLVDSTTIDRKDDVLRFLGNIAVGMSDENNVESQWHWEGPLPKIIKLVFDYTSGDNIGILLITLQSYLSNDEWMVFALATDSTITGEPLTMFVLTANSFCELSGHSVATMIMDPYTDAEDSLDFLGEESRNIVAEEPDSGRPGAN